MAADSVSHVEPKHLMELSIGKLTASHQKRGGASLHKSLLLSNVLQRARTVVMMETFPQLGQILRARESISVNQSSIPDKLKDNFSNSNIVDICKHGKSCDSNKIEHIQETTSVASDNHEDRHVAHCTYATNEVPCDTMKSVNSHGTLNIPNGCGITVDSLRSNHGNGHNDDAISYGNNNNNDNVEDVSLSKQSADEDPINNGVLVCEKIIQNIYHDHENGQKENQFGNGVACVGAVKKKQTEQNIMEEKTAIHSHIAIPNATGLTRLRCAASTDNDTAICDKDESLIGMVSDCSSNDSMLGMSAKKNIPNLNHLSTDSTELNNNNVKAIPARHSVSPQNLVHISSSKKLKRRLNVLDLHIRARKRIELQTKSSDSLCFNGRGNHETLEYHLQSAYSEDDKIQSLAISEASYGLFANCKINEQLPLNLFDCFTPENEIDDKENVPDKEELKTFQHLCTSKDGSPCTCLKRRHVEDEPSSHLIKKRPKTDINTSTIQSDHNQISSLVHMFNSGLSGLLSTSSSKDLCASRVSTTVKLSPVIALSMC